MRLDEVVFTGSLAFALNWYKWGLIFVVARMPRIEAEIEATFQQGMRRRRTDITPRAMWKATAFAIVFHAATLWPGVVLRAVLQALAGGPRK